MGCDLMLQRVTSFDLAEVEIVGELPPISFGSKTAIIDRLCSVVGFEIIDEEYFLGSEPCATIAYQYHHQDDEGDYVEFTLTGDPVTCIWIEDTDREDFYPIMEALKDLAPFAIFDLGDGILIDPEELDYTYDDWLQLQYDRS
jgi:hypothetical protein